LRLSDQRDVEVSMSEFVFTLACTVKMYCWALL